MGASYKEDRRRLSVDIPKDIYGKMLLSSMDRNCTMTKWVLKAIIRQLMLEGRHHE